MLSIKNPGRIFEAVILVLIIKLFSMSVKYSVLQQKYDITGNDVLKFFAKAQSSGVMDFKTICESISDRGTVTRGDVLAALDGCIYTMCQALKEGKIVRLGDFGSFQIGLSSEGTLTEKEFSSSKIKRARIRFRPGVDLSQMLTNMSYQKTSADNIVATSEEEVPEEVPETPVEG